MYICVSIYIYIYIYICIYHSPFRRRNRVACSFFTHYSISLNVKYQRDFPTLVHLHSPCPSPLVNHSIQLQVSFRERATDYRALLQK